MAHRDDKILKYDTMYLDIAKRIAQQSYAKRLQVGCVLVSNDNIISMGWNGMPTNMDNCCENSEGFTNPEVQHAEENAILKVARSTQNAWGSSAYVTHAPCMNCAKMLYGARISRLVYGEDYRDTIGLDFLRKTINEVVKL